MTRRAATRQGSGLERVESADALHYANQLIEARNKSQRKGRPAARLERVLVYRGLPSAEHDPKPYARNLAQKTEWERDPRVKVTLRPLKYRLRANSGWPQGHRHYRPTHHHRTLGEGCGRIVRVGPDP